MPEPGHHSQVLSQQQFAHRVPQLARRSLMSVRGCLDALAAEVSITPLLATPDTCYLVTPGFAVVIGDPALVDESVAPLFQHFDVEQVAALLNGGFTALWTPIRASCDSGRAIVEHAAARAAAASAALSHALRAGSGEDTAAILPMLAHIAADIAVPIGMLALQAADDADTATEHLATLLSALFTAAADVLDQLTRNA